MALSRLIDRNKHEILGFIDNRKAGSHVGGLSVYGVGSIASLAPDLILITVKGEDRQREIQAQLAACKIPVRLPETEMMDIRQAEIIRLADQIEKSAIPGAVAELGVYQGDLAVQLNRLFPKRKLYLFDTFSGFSEKDVAKEPGGDQAMARRFDFSDTSVQRVMSRMLHPAQIEIREGWFPKTATGLEGETFCFVSLDADLYEPVRSGLRFFYPRLSPGGYLVLHDADSAEYPGAGQALEDFCKEEGVWPIPLCDLHGSAILIGRSTHG